MTLKQTFVPGPDEPPDPSAAALKAVRARLVARDGGLSLDGSALFGGTAAELLDLIERTALMGRASLLVTLNVDQLIQYERDPGFAAVVRRAAIRCIDGMPVVALGRLLGASVSRNTGADLLFHASRESVARHWNVVIAGGQEDVTNAAVLELRSRYRGARVSAVVMPMLEHVGDPVSSQVVEALATEHPSVVFLCLGAPKQEMWFDRWQAALPPAVYVGAGAAVDYAAGKLLRAPRWLQAIGGEWVWRLLSEPRRLARRYLVRGPRFLAIAAASLRDRGRDGGA